MTARSNLCVIVAAPTLPPRGVNMTGSPALILKLYRELSAHGVDVRMMEIDMAGRSSHVSAFSRTQGVPMISFQIFKELQRAKPAVLHCHGHTTAGILMPYAWLCGMPVVCELHGLYVGSKRGVTGARPFLSHIAEKSEIAVLRRASRVIVQAETMRERILAAGIEPNRITRLYPGLRINEIRDYKGEEPAELAALPGTGTRVVYLGSHHAYQGLDLLQKAQRALRSDERGRFQFILVLSGDGTPVDVKSMYGFDDLTAIVNLRSSAAVPAWLKAADILIHSRPDIPDNVNVQSKLGLYLAAGRPIVATNVGDYQQLLGGLPGCVLASPNPEAIARAIQRAAEPAVREAALTNPETAAREFDISKNTETLIELYCELLSGRASHVA